MQREIAHMRRAAPGRMVQSIFFGGGTPSLMDPRSVGTILEAIGKHWQVDPTAPRSRSRPTRPRSRPTASAAIAPPASTASRSACSRCAPSPLAELGRLPTVEEAVAAVRLAQSIFPRSSFDLIYARPKQTLEDWQDELTEALWLAEGHLSLYQLTIEKGTRYFDLFHAGKLKMPDEDLTADMSTS